MHGIILHEEYRERMENLSDESLGKLVKNMFLVDREKEPKNFGDNYLDLLSDTVCGRVSRDISKSDKQRANRLGKTKNNQTKTKKKPNNNQTKTPITNNLLPITNNELNNSYVEQIVRFLNETTGKHYQPKGKTAEMINARLKDGYTVEDFKKVITVKWNEWKGTQYEEFVRPSTLFAPSHFEEYLNQKAVVKPSNVAGENSTIKFNRFAQRDIDFEELERRTVKN